MDKTIEKKSGRGKVYYICRCLWLEHFQEVVRVDVILRLWSFIVTGSSPLLSSRLLIFILHLSHLLISLSSFHDFPTISIYSLSPSLPTSSITLSSFFPSPIPHQRERYPLSRPFLFHRGR